MSQYRYNIATLPSPTLKQGQTLHVQKNGQKLLLTLTWLMIKPFLVYPALKMSSLNLLFMSVKFSPFDWLLKVQPPLVFCAAGGIKHLFKTSCHSRIGTCVIYTLYFILCVFIKHYRHKSKIYLCMWPTDILSAFELNWLVS